MAPKNNRDQNSGAQSFAKNQGRERHYILKRHAELLFKAFAAWALVAIALGGGLMNYRHTVAGCGLFGSAISIIVLDVHIHYRYRFRARHLLLRWPFVCVALFNVSLVPVSILVSVRLQGDRSFEIVTSTILFSTPNKAQFGPFVATENIGIPNKPVLSPINDLVFLELINTLDFPRHELKVMVITAGYPYVLST